MPSVSNGDIVIHYQLQGDNENEPLVLLHWFMGSHETWIDIGWVRSLKDHFYLILVDLRGYGESSKPHKPEAYHLKNHVSDIITLLDKLEISTAHFMGYSMGGRISFALMEYAPNRIRSLVIGGMHPYTDIPTDLDFRVDLLKKGMKTTLNAYEITPKSIYDKMLKNDPEALLADTLQAKKWTGFGDILSNFNKSVLLYVGVNDEFYKGVKRASMELRHASLVVFPNENHRTAFVKRRLLIPHLRRFYNKPIES